MLRYVQGAARGQEEDTDDEQPSTSSSGTHQPQPASRSVDSTTVPSPDQPPSTSSLGTDTQQRTTASENTSPDLCDLLCVLCLQSLFSFSVLLFLGVTL